MFGHQDDLAYGVNWKYQAGRSDVHDVTGEYPGIFGWELGHLELDKPMNLGSVPFDRIREYVQKVYTLGGVNTISWHFNNPEDPTKTAWVRGPGPKEPTIRHMLADPKLMKRYQSWLDRFAGFVTSLKGPKGEAIPIIFRPFHENSGSWFWWGRDECTPEEYQKIWRYTVDYLRKKKKLHNLLYAYSTDRFNSREDYLERYPGDNYVDILGFDLYDRSSATADTARAFVRDARRMVETVRDLGQEKHKVWALTETGLGRLPKADWWTQTLLPVVQQAGLSYVLVWRNSNARQFFAPYPGQASADDFKAFSQNPQVLFSQKTAAHRMYDPLPAQSGK
jgi:mannan endo-1,4-beta-mannosidase